MRKLPQLINEEGEIFADSFAGALLFPRESAEIAYQEFPRNTLLMKSLFPFQELPKNMWCHQSQFTSKLKVLLIIPGYHR